MPRRTMTIPTQDLQNKPLCELEGCPSIASETIELQPVIERFLNDTARNNPEANPLCIKRIVSKLLSEESARLFVGLVERDK